MLATTMHHPRTILLVKSQKFAHQAGYFLHQGRWHSVKENTAVPKGAPMAAHPQAAGDHKPVVLSPEQVEQLKYPADKAATNAEMKAFNEKHLPKLLAHGAAGNATALLGGGFGVNSHAKKQAAIANFLLQEMGSKHQVAPGQAAGAHAAVQSAPAAEPVPAEAKGPMPAPEPEPPTPEPAAPAAATLTAPEFAEGKKTANVKAYYNAKAAEIIAAPDLMTLQAIKKPELGSWQGKTPNSKKLLALFDQAEASFAPAAQPPADPPSVEPVAAPVAPVAEASAPAPDYSEAKKHVDAWAESGKWHEIEQALKNDQTAPELKQHLRAALAKKPAPPEPTPAPAEPATGALTADQLGKLQSIPWFKLKLPDTNTNASSVNKKLQALKDAAFAGDVAAIEGMKFGKNTYNAKLALVAQTAIAAIHEGKAAEPAPAADPFEGLTPASKKGLDALAAAGDESAKMLLQTFSTSPTSPEPTKAYAKHLLENLKAAPPAAAQETGPKDGDTKPAADGGMLVFKNGRWHKSVAADESGEVPPVLVPVDDTPPAAPEPTVKALTPKQAISLGAGLKTAAGNKAKLKAMAVAGNVEQLANFIATNGKNQPASKMYAQKLIDAMTDGTPAAVLAPKPKATAAAAAPAAGPALESIDTWAQTGPQGGSNPGGRFKDAEGVEWYCKFPANEDIAKSEVLAAKLYGAVGVSGQDAKLITKGGKVGIASRWVTVNKAGSPAELAKVQGAQSGFAVDAWLGNWDVVGMGYDNLQVGADGKAVRVDAGGSLEYRAQGSKKPFGASVDELTTMRDAKVNPQAAAIFGKMTQADITASAAKVAGISDPQIRAIVEEFGPGDKAARKALADVLIARKADIVAKYPKAGKTPKKRLDPTKLPVQAASLPQPHDFANWNGAGQGLSSKPHINAANQSVEQAALDTAMVGNLVALKEFKYTGIDKDTGNAGSAPLPIAQHPSKHVVQYHADLVQALDEIANPPEALKAFRETDIGTLSALEAAYPPKPFGTTVGSVSSNEKMGFWVALGQVAGASVKKLAPKKVSDYSSAAIAAAKAKYKDAAPLAKHFIKSVQSSGSYNDLFRDGKTMDHSGNKLADVAQAALAHATQMPEGTTLYRWQKMTDQMLKHIMAAPDGTVFQATGPMCTSYSPTSTAGFGKHRVVIRYAEGAKAVESFGSGGFAGEKEVTTLPNNRYVILSKKMVPDVEHGYASGERLELEILMLPPDLGLPGVKG